MRNAAGGDEHQLSDPHDYTRLARGEAVPSKHAHSELPLILFTLLVSMSVGVVFFNLICDALQIASSMIANPDEAFEAGISAPVFSAFLVTIGMVASVVHLAKPLKAPTSLRHLSTSWLSREILLVAAYWTLLCCWSVACFLLPSTILLILFEMLSLTLGVILLFVVARAYKVHAQPLWDGPECALELLAAALGAGVAWGAVVVDVLPALAEVAICGLCLIGSRFAYESSNQSRLRRLSVLGTPRERAAELKLVSLGGRQRTVMLLIDAAILLCLFFLALCLLFGEAAPASPIVPACIAAVAFFEARSRFYEMAIIIRPAIRRNYR